MELINSVVEKELVSVFNSDFTNTNNIIRYGLLKWIYNNTELCKKCNAIQKFIYYTLTSENIKLLNGYLQNNDLNFYNLDLYHLCSKYLDDINKNSYGKIRHEWIKKFIAEDFVIFPTNLDKSPLYSKWCSLTQTTSRELYSENNYISNRILSKNNSQINNNKDINTTEKTYRTFRNNYINNNFGLLCGIQSFVVVLDIDIKDGGKDYWYKLLDKYNKSKDIDTLKAISGSGGYHYFFEYESHMNYWRTSNKLFSTKNKKVGIDFRTNNGYIVLPPSIHPETAQQYRFENITLDDSIRSRINTMPTWLFILLDDWFLKFRENDVIPNYNKPNIKPDVKPFIVNSYGMAYRLLKFNTHFLKYIPDNLKTKEMCFTAVRKNSIMIQYVPNKYKTKILCDTAFNKNTNMIKFIPPEYITHDMCMKAVTKYPMILESISLSLKTFELCELAVSLNGLALCYTPYRLLTEALCAKGIANNILAEIHIPNNFRTSKMYQIAVGINYKVLSYIKPQDQTLEICEEAINNSGNALPYVTPHLITYDLCLKSVKQYGEMLFYVPNNFKTVYLCRVAITNYGMALVYVPERYRTLEMSLIAIKNNVNAIKYVPIYLITYGYISDISKFNVELKSDPRRDGEEYTEREFNIASVILQKCRNNYESYLLGLCIIFSYNRSKIILDKIIDND